MTIALVAHVGGAPGANGGTTGGIDTTGATLLVLHVSSLVTMSGVSDSKGNTWTALTQRNTSSRFSRLWYCAAPTVGAGHTFTASTTGSQPTITVGAFSSAATVAPFDVENGASTGGATSLATGSVTPTQNNELVVTGFVGPTAGLATIGSGFTVSDAIAGSSGVNLQGAMAYLIQTTAGAVNPTWSGFTGSAAASIATFKAGGGLTAHLAVTEGNDTLAGTATVLDVAQLGVTEGNDTLAGTATVLDVAQLGVTEGNDTLAGTATTGHVATLSVTEGNDTLVATATVGDVATLAVTEARDTLIATAEVGPPPPPPPPPHGRPPAGNAIRDKPPTVDVPKVSDAGVSVPAVWGLLGRPGR